MSINYSKWDHIEISDDEDDTHPNIDTASLFRWRHQARIEKMEQAKKERESFEESVKTNKKRLEEKKQKLNEADKVPSAELAKLKIEISELEKQEKEFFDKEEALKKKEKLTPWNVDTLCHDKSSKTLINVTQPKRQELSEEEKTRRQEIFIKEHKKEVEKFGMIKRPQDSMEYLLDNNHLVCEETANYLVMWCIELEMEEKKNLMEHVSHQTIVMQFILELAKQLDRDPRDCVRTFFGKMTNSNPAQEKQYMAAFEDELNAFKGRVRARAKEKLEESIRQIEEEERQKRLGPGGLDPVEVFESLPDVLKECFEQKDIQKLKDTIVTLEPKDAEYHMKRCIDSGLWVPEGGVNKSEEEESNVGEASTVE
ncbi:hsp90 co-chaperone Cdc37 isoform X1 [Octopus bimaculoides]|nr:hsp90 co-chaperone Cdc37 isoform X1 [Octopus bimaculoides]